MKEIVSPPLMVKCWKSSWQTTHRGFRSKQKTVWNVNKQQMQANQLLDLISLQPQIDCQTCEWGSTIPHLIAPRYEETWNLEGQWKKNDACIAPKESSFTEKVNVHLLNHTNLDTLSKGIMQWFFSYWPFRANFMKKYILLQILFKMRLRHAMRCKTLFVLANVKTSDNKVSLNT